MFNNFQKVPNNMSMNIVFDISDVLVKFVRPLIPWWTYVEYSTKSIVDWMKYNSQDPKRFQ